MFYVFFSVYVLFFFNGNNCWIYEFCQLYAEREAARHQSALLMKDIGADRKLMEALIEVENISTKMNTMKAELESKVCACISEFHICACLFSVLLLKKTKKHSNLMIFL